MSTAPAPGPTPPPSGWMRVPDDSATQHEEVRNPGLPFTVATFVLLGVGALLFFAGSFEMLGWSLLLFVAALVTGIIGSVLAIRHKRSGATAAAVSGAALGGVGAALVVVAIVVMLILAAIAELMACLFTFGLAC